MSICMKMYGDSCEEAYWSTFVFLAAIYTCESVVTEVYS